MWPNQNPLDWQFDPSLARLWLKQLDDGNGNSTSFDSMDPRYGECITEFSCELHHVLTSGYCANSDLRLLNKSTVFMGRGKKWIGDIEWVQIRVISSDDVLSNGL